MPLRDVTLRDVLLRTVFQLDLKHVSADSDIINAFCGLRLSQESEYEITHLEKFACQVYFSVDNTIVSLKSLRCQLFYKNMADSEKLSPTPAAFKEHYLRANFQASIWCQAHILVQSFAVYTEYGWTDTDGYPVLTTTKLPLEPEEVIEFVKCNCKKDNYVSHRCGCRSRGLSCTDICQYTEYENEDKKKDKNEDNGSQN